MANISSSMTLEKPGVEINPDTDTELDAPLTPERLARENRRHDLVLTGLVFLLGLLLASFPIANPDIWMHLRIGEMILNGTFQFGVDPFAYTTDGTLWVHAAWLCDAFYYAVYQLGGGPGLVLLRGLLIVGLMWLMFRTCRTNGSQLAALLCIGLAVLTLSQQLVMSPELMSYCLLGLTIYLLYHPPIQTQYPQLNKLVGLTQNRLWVFLPPLFLLWANLDAWFILGPITVALYLIGETMAQTIGRVTFRAEALSPLERRKLAVVLLAGLAACVINPYHYHIFAVPGELNSDAMTYLKTLPSGERLGISPFAPKYFGTGRTFFQPRGLSIAQWCYYPLVLLGLISFVLNIRRGSWSRFLIWFGCFALSAWQERNTGYFAVVAGPLTALNFQDWLEGQYGSLPSVKRRRVALAQAFRAFVLLILVGLTALMFVRYEVPEMYERDKEAALGLVHSRGALGWSIFADASWSQCTKQLHAWREAGLLPGRAFYFGFNALPSYAAWFDPPQSWQDPQTHEKHWSGLVFMDGRFSLHTTGTVQDFFDVVNNLQDTGQGPQELHDHWRSVFEKYDISHLVIAARREVLFPDKSDPTRVRRIRRTLVDVLLDDRDEKTGKNKWELLDYVDGRTAVLAWTGSPHWPQLEKLRYDAVREAFQQPRHLPPADDAASHDRPSGIATILAGEIRQPPLGFDEARWHRQRALQGFGMKRAYGSVFNTAVRSVTDPTLAMVGALPAAPPLLSYVPVAPPVLDPTVEAEIWLAIRAARRGLAERPDSADAYYELYQGYYLWQQTRIESSLSPVAQNPMRGYQMHAALRAAAMLKTANDPWEPHLRLVPMYLGMGFLDIAVQHYRMGYQLALAAGSPDSEKYKEVRAKMSQEQWEKYVGGILQQSFGLRPLEELEIQLKQQQAKFNLNVTTAQTSLEAANMARDHFLGDERRQYLEKALSESTPQQSEYQRAFASLMELYMMLGLQREPQLKLMQREAPQMLGSMKYAQYGVSIEAGYGRYAAAGQQLSIIDQYMKQNSIDQALSGLGLQTMLGDSFMGLQNVLGYDPIFERGGTQGAQWIPERVGVWNQMGLIAIEAGQVQQAADLFRKAAEEFDENSPYLPLSARYYKLLTGKSLEPRK